MSLISELELNRFCWWPYQRGFLQPGRVCRAVFVSGIGAWLVPARRL